MKILLLLCPLLLLTACSDEQMAKWKEMNEDRVEPAPNEDPNLPQAEGDMEALKRGFRQIGDRTREAVDGMMKE